MLFLPAVVAFCEQGDSLPDAPSAHGAERGGAPVSKVASKGVEPVSRYEPAPLLDARDKMLYWLREQTNPMSLFPTFASAAFGQLIDTDPK
ncbi:MAG: hypothetical protein JO300_01595 [Silvibacterium sp.]|nr:hypothetical protein [Silvibacterium sp.]